MENTKKAQALEQADKVLRLANNALRELDKMTTTLEHLAHAAIDSHDIAQAFAVSDVTERFAKLMGFELDELASDITIARNRIADGLAEPEAEEELDAQSQ